MSTDDRTAGPESSFATTDDASPRTDHPEPTTPAAHPRRSVSAPSVIGDEREHAVANEAAAVGMSAGIYAGLGIALVAAVLGSLVVPVVAVALTAIPSWTMMLWARRRGVDLAELAGRLPARQKTRVWAVAGVGLLLVLAALAWTLFTGDALVALPSVEVAGPDATGIAPSVARGAVIGGFAGLLVAVVTSYLPGRRRNRDDA
ncbi:hypothetical protein ACPYO6_15530 [Georgenia sp. Z1344]|uniref:hypothetical protein n=1 Tax=Georgenia sp. Z1344 TaxID=3416706 RepID=UPI003CEC0D11